MDEGWYSGLSDAEKAEQERHERERDRNFEYMGYVLRMARHRDLFGYQHIPPAPSRQDLQGEVWELSSARPFFENSSAIF